MSVARYVVDTDLLIMAERNLPEAKNMMKRLARHDIFASVISYKEMAAGEYGRDARVEQNLKIYFRGIDILPIDEDVAKKAARESLKLNRSDFERVHCGDLWIAATALVHNLPLVTSNIRDYRLFPSLKIVNWLNP